MLPTWFAILICRVLRPRKKADRLLTAKPKRQHRSCVTDPTKCRTAASGRAPVSPAAPVDYLSSRRRDDTLPAVRMQADDEALNVTLPAGWLDVHPLRAELLEQESHYQSYVHWQLSLT